MLRNKKTIDEDGFTLMTLPYLQQLCREHKGYNTPYLNDVLYLHYKGFSELSKDLRHYSGIKSLWLECNALSKLDHLDAFPLLRCLYLQENCLQDMNALVDARNLTILNISQNNLLYLPQALGSLVCLTSLHASNNRFRTRKDVQVVARIKNLSVLDLHTNQLQDNVCDLISELQNIAVVTLHHNPFLQTTSEYRRNMILSIKSLTFLDDSPVSNTERRVTMAWKLGGREAEVQERQRIRDEEQREHMRSFVLMEERRRAHQIALSAESLRGSPTLD